jgi:hypothetical protein
MNLRCLQLLLVTAEIFEFFMHLHHFVGRRSSLCLPEKLDWGELGKFNHSVLRKELAQIVNLDREGLCKLEYFLV